MKYSPDDPSTFYTQGEEIANSITHGIGTGLSIAGLTVLLVLAAQSGGDNWRMFSFSVYGASLVFLYLASTLYHSIHAPRIKRVLRIVDHAAIYLLIAGTYTPFLLVSLRGTMGWTVFTLVWILALIGVVFKLFFTGRYDKFATILYVLMGWMSVLAAKEILELLPIAGIAWLLAGGLVYTSGVIFYLWNRLPYNHAVWHLFVLGGSICHYLAILLHVLPTA